MTLSSSYLKRRDSLETYFDRTAVDAWQKLTSTEPVSGVRATVRAGRDRMRSILLSWLPADMRGARLLDAGCGTGALAVEAAKRGANVVAIDLSPTLVNLAKERMPADLPGRIEFMSGDMLNPALGAFDYCVAMDSVIHYRAADMTRVIEGLAERTDSGVLFTFAPRTALLTVALAAGRIFPRSDRSPSIEPVSEGVLRRSFKASLPLARWSVSRTERVSSGFYTSQAMELVS